MLRASILCLDSKLLFQSIDTTTAITDVLEAVLKDPRGTLSFDRICNKSILLTTAVAVSHFQPRRSRMESSKPTRSKEPSSNGFCYDLVLEMEHKR